MLHLCIVQLCKETSKRPSKVLLYFPQERTTGIAPSRLILGKSFEYKEGSTVTVNWEGKKTSRDYSYNEEILNQKDIEWSSKFISATEPDPISNQSKLPESSVTFGNPYSAFLAEQKKREVEWATNRANKKAKCTATTEKDLEAVKQQLAAKEPECKTLKG
ncbi:unnamed protein product [Pocillopora meandrina]|uniref:Uncharacterized protein n=1 Tax=Pocillopora meandrina TaxID=46732 RepID=A0AAU9VMZ0_9CNID|nr:unnamed protein product [Pocillopora meandrina]